jgi:hypothetical protein
VVLDPLTVDMLFSSQWQRQTRLSYGSQSALATHNCYIQEQQLSSSPQRLEATKQQSTSPSFVFSFT